jgi:hypothetical protein
LQYPHIAAAFFLAITPFCSAEAAKHLSAERFLADFVVTRCSNVNTLQAATRQKLQKYTAERLMCSALFGYSSKSNSGRFFLM